MSIYLKRFWIRIRLVWRAVEQIGMDSNMPYLLNKELRMLNILTLSCCLLPFLYGVNNLLVGRMVLATLDFLLAFAALYVFRLNYQHQYSKAQMYLLIVAGLFLSMTNLVSNNATEYYLVCVLIASFLIFHKMWIQIITTIFLLLSILIPKFYPFQFRFSDQVSDIRLLVNSLIAIFIMFILVRYFKFFQYEYQKKIKNQHMKLEELNHGMEQLFAIISHDIRSPLTGINQTFQLVLQDELSSEERSKVLTLTFKQLQALKDNIDNLLHWSSQNLHGVLNHSNFLNFEEILKEILIHKETMFKEKNIAFEVEVQPELTVFADYDHIRIIIGNLLNNASKFSHQNGVIRIKAYRDGEKAKITIADQGVGMSDEKVERLFGNLQEPAYGTSGERGSGVGLMLVYNLLKANHGTITVESAVNVGSKFIIELPTKKENG